MNAIGKNRAWMEISLKNLEYNVKQLQKYLQGNCELMAVIKANAYGHEAVAFGKKLNEIGIFHFAVATLNEGIELRKNGVKGDILILGYTDFSCLQYVIDYDLIQTVVDYNYAKKIKTCSLNGKLKVHIKVNTGMNRIGEGYENIDFIKEIYHMPYLQVLGIFSHFCVADSVKKEDIAFSKQQINRFENVINELKKDNIAVGKVHIQNSYGLIHYNDLKYDYARVGIFLYGVFSEKQDRENFSLNLKPVLSIYARVVSVKWIDAHEFVSYGRTYETKEKRKIATVSIGYADGIPRNISGRGMNVSINNCHAPIIGRVCMDQMVVDVTDIENVMQGDIVTIIGKDITIEDLAEKSDSITNELLSRLGSRLEKIIQ